MTLTSSILYPRAWIEFIPTLTEMLYQILNISIEVFCTATTITLSNSITQSLSLLHPITLLSTISLPPSASQQTNPFAPNFPLSTSSTAQSPTSITTSISKEQSSYLQNTIIFNPYFHSISNELL